jgi:methionine synthase II (cobalamin-independent)
VTFPSPFALSLGTGLSPKEVADNVLRPALEGVEAELVVLAEPFLAREESPALDGLAEALEGLGDDLALWIEFGDAGSLLGRGLADLPVDGIGIDFYATHLDDVPDGFDKLLLAGVLDARNSLPEEPREIATFVERLEVERIALVPNGDLQYVSEPVAREKLARLGKAKTASTEAAA